MEKSTIIQRLLELPAAIAVAERKVITVQFQLMSAKADLQNKEDGLLLGSFEEQGWVIDGKNAEIRQAQMRHFTEVEQDRVSAAEDSVTMAKHDLSILYNELKALQAVADLMRGAA
jgi:hypothetical protein